MSSSLGSFFPALAAALCCAVCLCANVQAAPPRAPVEQMAAPAPASSQPKPSRPKVAAYFEAGPYWEFTLLQKEIIKALRQRGVADRITLPDELYISPGWDASESVYRAEARKLMQNPDIDVIISMGTEATKALLAENNARTLSRGSFDAVIPGCATCGSALSKEYGEVLQNSDALSAWEGFKDKVFDFSDFLTMLGPEPYVQNVPLKATYHDACHLVRGMGVSKQPRSLIRAIPGLRFVEMSRPDVCCGCAGTFSATHYDLSQQILADKTSDILSTGADVVATGCSACKMQLIDGLSHRGANVRVLHTAELLAKAYGL